jgi:hypothetical protein
LTPTVDIGDTSLIATRKGRGIAFLPEQSRSSIKTEWMTLPDELLALIMCKIDDYKSLLALSITCQQFQAIYQDKRVYQAHERQHHLLLYHLTTPALCEKLYVQFIHQEVGKLTIPNPATDEWKALRDQAPAAHLTREARQIAFIKKIYLLTWDLLLQAKVLKNPSQAAELMRVLLDVLPHIEYAEEYAAKLFGEGFPWEIFSLLATVHLDRCLQIIAHHFPAKDFADFIKTQLTIALPDKDIVECKDDLKAGYIKNFLLFVLPNFLREEEFTPKYHALSHFLHLLLKQGCDLEQRDTTGKTALSFMVNCMRIKHLAARCYPLIELLLQHGADCNARDTEGYTPLMLACSYKLEEVISLLLQQPHIDVNVKNNAGNSMLHNAAIGTEDLPILHGLLQHPQIDVNAKNNEGFCPLEYVMSAGVAGLPKLQALLQHPKIEVNIKGRFGEYLLHTVDGPVLLALLQHPHIDVNKRNRYGSHILASAAAFIEDVKIFMVLLTDQRIDLHIRLTEFNDSIKWKREHLTQAFLQSDKMSEQEKRRFINQALALAIQENQLSVATTLIDYYGASDSVNLP